MESSDRTLVRLPPTSPPQRSLKSDSVECMWYAQSPLTADAQHNCEDAHREPERDHPHLPTLVLQLVPSDVLLGASVDQFNASQEPQASSNHQPSLDPRAVRMCDDDVDVVALRFASPVPTQAHSQTAQTAARDSKGPGYTLSVTMLLGWYRW